MCHRYKKLADLQNFGGGGVFCFERVKALENVSEKLYTSKVKK